MTHADSDADPGHLPHPETTPADIAPTAALLDRLARADRDGAPTGLESRLASASLSALRGDAQPESAVVARIGASGTTARRLRAAAGLLILGAGAAVVSLAVSNSTRPGVDPTALSEAALLQQAEEAVEIALAGWSEDRALASATSTGAGQFAEIAAVRSAIEGFDPGWSANDADVSLEDATQ